MHEEALATKASPVQDERGASLLVPRCRTVKSRLALSEPAQRGKGALPVQGNVQL